MRRLRWPHMGQWFSISVAGLVSVAICIVYTRWEGPSRPLDGDPTTYALLFFLWLPPLISSLGSYRRLRRRNLATIPSRTRKYSFRPDLASEITSYLCKTPLLVALACTYSKSWDFTTIGFHTAAGVVLPVLGGLVAAILFRRALKFGYRHWQSDREFDVFRVATLRASLPRGPVTRFMGYADVILFGPIVEEVVFRGFFVFNLGTVLGIPWGILVGFVLFAALHLYLGPDVMRLSVPGFYVVTVALLYSPLGLLSTISFHIYCNAYSVWKRRESAASYMAHVQSRRAARQLAR